MTPEELIPDPAFRTCLEDILADYGIPGGITEENLAGMTSVGCMRMGIKSAEGAQWLTGLHSLNLDSNELTTMPSLAPLTQLTSISIEINHLTNLDFLADVTLAPGASTVGFMDNELTDVSGLSGLVDQVAAGSGMYLDLSENELTDEDIPVIAAFGATIESVRGFKNILTVDIFQNHFRDLSGLSGLHLSGTKNNKVRAGCQDVNLGEVAAGASVPFALRDALGNKDLIVMDQRYTGPWICNDTPQWAGVYEGALPVGISWDGNVLVADPSLIGQTVAFVVLSEAEAGLQYTRGSFKVSFTVGEAAVTPPPAPPAPPVAPPVTPSGSQPPAAQSPAAQSPASPSSKPSAAPGESLAQTGVPSGLIGFGVPGALLLVVAGVVLFVVRRRKAS